MFNKLTDMIDNALTVIISPISGDLPTQRQVSKLIADGVSIAGIAVMFGVGVDAIEGLIESGETQ